MTSTQLAPSSKNKVAWFLEALFITFHHSLHSQSTVCGVYQSEECHQVCKADRCGCATRAKQVAVFPLQCFVKLKPIFIKFPLSKLAICRCFHCMVWRAQTTTQDKTPLKRGCGLLWLLYLCLWWLVRMFHLLLHPNRTCQFHWLTGH